MKLDRIYKYGPLRVTGSGDWQSIEMPEFAGIVHFGEQPNIGGDFYFWAVVEPSEIGDRNTRYFKVLATGQEIPEDAMYVQTLIASDATVWHLFEKS